MTDKATTTPPAPDGRFMMDKLDALSMEETVWLTIRAMHDDLDGSDMAAAKLALEVAARIDVDGLDCGVSLYTRLSYLLTGLRHRGDAPRCPLAQGVPAST